MRRHHSVPTNSQSKCGSRSVTPSIISPSSSAVEDDVFSVVTLKMNRDRSERFMSQEVQGGDADAVANGNSVARRRHILLKRTNTRLVSKEGVSNVSPHNMRHRRKRYLADIFTTLIDMKWRYYFIVFGFAYLGSWCVFGLFWWSLAMVNEGHLYPNSTSLEVCVTGIYDYPSALLFSFDTQSTIGYGVVNIEPHCPQGILLLMFQACFGLFIESIMTGLVFAKLSRPKHRSQTMMFSRNAVICLRDGEYCLLFRLGDMRGSHLVDTSIRALIVTAQCKGEKETVSLGQSRFALETETNVKDRFLFLHWPITLVHRIGPDSPLYTLSAEKLLTTDFEIVVILEGDLQSTGYTVQILTSYLQSEVLWGHRLVPLVTYEKCNGRYEIDFKQFHSVIPVASMPNCSAKEYAERSTERNGASVASVDQYPFSFIAHGSCRTTSQTSLRRSLSRRCWSKRVANGGCVSGKTFPRATNGARKFGRQPSADVYSKTK